MATAFERYNDIKDDLKSRYDEIINSQDPDALVMEIAVAWIPVYYNDIISEWHKEMPSEFDNRWQEFGINEKSTITELMAIDLDFWYSEMGGQAWHEIAQEMPALEEAENA
jgi:hypothetical protein